MKVGDYFIRESVPQRIANAKGKYSTLFMSGDMKNVKNYGKKTGEERTRMAGYNVNVRNPGTSRADTMQPMAGYSEFWIS